MGQIPLRCPAHEPGRGWFASWIAQWNLAFAVAVVHEMRVLVDVPVIFDPLSLVIQRPRLISTGCYLRE